MTVGRGVLDHEVGSRDSVGMRAWGSVFWLLGLWLWGSGCHPGGAASELVRPETPEAGDVMADTLPCRDPGSYAEPLIVDWSSAGRLDLEVAMKRGVAVVAYDCKALRLLNGCQLPARYAFAGVTMKEEVIQLATADEVTANLPLTGIELAASMGAESSLDLALVMVGKRSSALAAADRTMLDGACDGATHFVRAATVGAFAMARGARGEVRVATEVFGVGAEAGSRSERQAKTTDGDRAACRQSRPEDTEPSPGCGASLRLELVPIAVEAPTEARDDDDDKVRTKATPSCPAGMTMVAGKCVDGGEELAACEDQDRGACRRLCQRGSAHGCYQLGRSEAWDRNVPVTQALESLERACDLGSEQGCYQRAWIFYNHFAYPKVHDDAKAVTLARASCARGGAKSCGLLATRATPALPHNPPRPHQDEAVFRRFAQRACDLGDSSWCQNLARHLLGKEGTEAEGLALYRRACEGGAAQACRAWGEALRTRKDGKGLAEAFTLGCRHGLLILCGEAARPIEVSTDGLERRTEERDELARRGCFLGNHAYACWVLAMWGPMDERGKAARRGCDTPYYMKQKAQLCDTAAYHAGKRARELDLKGCDAGNAESCDRVANRDYARACELGKTSACRNLRARAPLRYRRLMLLLCEAKPGVDEPWCDLAAQEGVDVPKAKRR
jgi:uncharacterized protein